MGFSELGRYMVCEDDIETVRSGDIILGYDFKCRYPSYRGAYLCNILELRAFIDGEEIPQRNIRFGVNDKFFLLSEIEYMFKEYWFTGVKAIVRIIDDKGLAPGEHKVKLCMKHKIPYTGYFGNYVICDDECEKTLNIKG